MQTVDKLRPFSMQDNLWLANEKRKQYRQQLKALNRAHRLLRLEYKELKGKYDAIVDAATKATQTLDYPGHTDSAGGRYEPY